MSIFSDFTPYDDHEPAGLELPSVVLPDSLYKKLGLTNDSPSYDVLMALVNVGIKKRGIDKYSNRLEYYERVNSEVDVLEELGFIDYILLNWEVIDHAIKIGVPIGDGRGSAAGSLVSYLLHITNKDPIKHHLYFERFVSRSRAKKITDKHGKEFLVGALAPDVDTDIGHSRRHEVIEYIEEKHKGRTARISTLNTFTSKLCIKEAVKYFGAYTEEQANRISDMIPKDAGVVFSLERAREEVERFKEWVEEDNNIDIYNHALVLENLVKNLGVHASGIAICSQDIRNVAPLQLTKDGSLVVAYDMDDVADLMVKFDILGLKTLTIAANTCSKSEVIFETISTDDESIYEELQDFRHPTGLFQISARTNCQVVQKVKPVNLQELSDVVAMARPAALQFVDTYVSQKQHPEKLGINDDLDEILADTKNVMLFQEQVMRACHEVFGMTLDDAEQLRRAIGKKKVDEIPKWRNKIFEAAEKKGVDVEVAQYFWDVVELGAKYQFNASHSLCYAALAAKTVWLKFKYPKEFFCSILEIAEDYQDPLEIVADVTREIIDFGIDLLPPRLDKSEMDFTIEGDNIRYGLESIKGISQGTKASLKEFSERNPKNKYEVFRDAKACKINIGALTSLIYAGALGPDARGKTALEAQAYNLLTEREKRNIFRLGKRYGYKLLESIKETSDLGILGDDDKPIWKKGRFETFKAKYDPYKTLYLENRERENLAIWWFERKLLGYSYTLKLRDCFNFSSLDAISEIPEKKSWRVVGHVDDVMVRVSKNENRYMKLTVSDEVAQQDFIFCDAGNNRKLTKWLEDHTISKEDIVIVRGATSNTGSYFVNGLDVVNAKIYTKIRQLK